MINPNELRVDNYVAHSDHPGDYFTIRGVCKDRVHPIELIDNSGYAIKEDDLSKIMPIPITPELLEKCGFTKMGSSVYTDVECYELDGYFMAGGQLHKFINNNTSVFLNIKIKFLHQIQNIFFALRNKELTINL